jgi:hypothetical protein
MAQIQSGVTADLATVDPVLKALYVAVKNTLTTTHSHDDFTLDSFERQRVSEPRIAFEFTFGPQLASAATTIWESTAVASGTIALTANLYGQDLSSLLTNGSGYWIQSYNHIKYAPGISTIARITFNLNELVTNVRSRVGVFTDQGTFPSNAGDGLYFEADGQSLSFVRRYMTTGAVGAEERVLRSSWNRDKLDGSGASGITLDFTKAQHLVIEYQWLGVGTIRYGFETGLGGVVWAHEMQSVNSLTQSWSRTGSLPVRAEVYNTGITAQAGKLTLINVVVIQEGDVVDFRGWKYFGGNSGATGKLGGIATGLYPVLSLRAASTNDLTKRVRVIPTSVTITVAVVSTGATSLQVALLMLPTPNTGATFATTPAGSLVSIDTIATAATAVTGTAIWNTIVPNVVGTYTYDLKTMNDNANVIGYNAAGTVAITGPSVMCLAAGPLTGTASVGATIAAAINWKELG